MILFDSREGRVLGEAPRRMNDDDEYEWLSDKATGDVDHLLLVDTLPFLVVPAFHHFEAWNEAVASGAWGRWATGFGEKVRRALDLEHWAAFNFSFRRLVKVMTEVASGKRGRPPATIIGLGGDVHHAYLAEVGFRKEVGARSAVYQAVCSPFRNPLDGHERAAIHAGISRAGARVGALLARAAGVPPESLDWTIDEGPWFDNQVATLELDGRHAAMLLDKVVGPGDEEPRLERVMERRLC
jgi:hypothetical protein